MKKIVTVVGARPQFIKAAAVSRVLREKYTEILVHTGQHYDYNMSEQFFDELDIPKPDYNLGISGGTHGQMTGKMLMAIEEVLIKEEPDMLLVYGDTNSTIAAALAAAKLHIPVCHIEAGTRTHSMTNPEELNRVCTDHISSILLTSTELNQENLKKEDLLERATFVGDPMYDAFVMYSEKAQGMTHSLVGLDGRTVDIPTEFYYLTCHREENTNTEENLLGIFNAMEKLDAPVIYPVHPRNKQRASSLVERYNFKNIILSEPVGYLTSLYLVSNAKKVVTDSGGLQREAFFAGVQCVTVLNFEIWPETIIDNRNVLAKPDTEDILNKLNITQRIDDSYMPFGDGKSSRKMIEALDKFFGGK